MISVWEIWAAAQQVIKQHGGKAPEAVAERITDLALKGDAEGVATWRAIAARVDQLTDFQGARQTRH